MQVVEIEMVFPPKTNGWKLKINENDLFEQETCSSNTMMFIGKITILPNPECFRAFGGDSLTITTIWGEIPGGEVAIG